MQRIVDKMNENATAALANFSVKTCDVKIQHCVAQASCDNFLFESHTTKRAQWSVLEKIVGHYEYIKYTIAIAFDFLVHFNSIDE